MIQKRIVIIGGGTGTFTVLGALKKLPVHLTAIVSMADDGGATGILRDQYGVLPPGDIRRALVALSPRSATLRKLFTYRFKNGDFGGHAFGNIFLSVMEKIEGNFARAVKETARILDISGDVIPVTLDSVRLIARLTDKSFVVGETNIDIPRSGARKPIASVWLDPRARINPDARRAIQKAHTIIIGPGDLYTSIVPNLLVDGVSESIKKSKAVKIYVGNLMTKRGETDSYKAPDFLKTMEKYLGTGIFNYVLFNNKKPAQKILARYRKEGAKFVIISNLKKNSRKPAIILTDLLASGNFIRHDLAKLGAALKPLIER